MTKRTLGVVLLLGLCAAVPAVFASGPKITRFRRGLHGFPMSMTAGPGKSVWFTEGVGPNLAGAIGKVSTRGRIREFHVGGHMYAEAAPIAVGPDKHVWVA